MPLSEKEEEEFISTIGKMEDIERFFESERMKNVNISYENWAIFLSYVSSERLVKHSKRLTWLTIGLLLAALGMIGLAIAQLVALAR